MDKKQIEALGGTQLAILNRKMETLVYWVSKIADLETERNILYKRDLNLRAKQKD